MIEIVKESILKSTPDYEDYTENEVKLSIEEMRELGLIKECGCKCSKNKCCKSHKDKSSCCKRK